MLPEIDITYRDIVPKVLFVPRYPHFKIGYFSEFFHHIRAK
ncbi:hypothetical protein EV194_1062 [Natronoflexus pectinivorans]|uniref:Uncharacterized protein n=1 Tax=Natronoflexus pectinivorans TaxID=682526 RepID=A0A4R2GIV0_9BACT|nr:hypothetical protein EV194_1062 [Natronoflexus pectinivorans]